MAPTGTASWRTTDTDVVPAPAQVAASFAREEQTDTVAVSVVVPTTDSVVE